MYVLTDKSNGNYPWNGNIPALLPLDPIEVPLIDDASDNLLEILSDIMQILFHLMILHCVNVISIVFDIFIG